MVPQGVNVKLIYRTEYRFKIKVGSLHVPQNQNVRENTDADGTSGANVQHVAPLALGMLIFDWWEGLRYTSAHPGGENFLG